MKKEEKKAARDQIVEEEYDENSTGSKLAVVLVTLLIIVVWLGILALLIKLDVGGVGSGVLRPLLEDVPGLQRILPEDEETMEANEEAKKYEESEYPYSSLGEAIDQIKVMELDIEQLQKASQEKDGQIQSLQSEKEGVN